MARTPDIERREEIARAALALMQEQGVHNTTMSGIARALGMKRPTLYWYFKDMGEIFEAALRALLEEQQHYAALRLGTSPHPIDLLFNYARSVDDFFSGREDKIVFLFQLWAVGNGVSPDATRAIEISREYFLPRRQAAIEVVAAGIAEGLVAPCDPAALVHFVSAFIDGLLVQRVVHPGPLPAMHDFLWEHVLKPLKRDPS